MYTFSTLGSRSPKSGKISLAIAAVCTVLGTCFAVPVVSAWNPTTPQVNVATFAGVEWDTGYSVAVDSLGNSYVTGTFQATVDFDPSVGTANLTSGGSYDIFVAKLDPLGNYVWARQIGSTLSDSGYSIAVDAAGNSYVTGEFNGTVDFDPGMGTANLTPAGSADGFVLKLNTAGEYVWAKKLGGSAYEYGWSITADAAGNNYIAGFFGGTADFDPGTGVANLVSAGSDDAFIVKLNTAGEYVWAKQFSGTNREYANSVVVDLSGNTYISGDFKATVDFDPSASTENLVSAGDYDVFVVKLNSAGEKVWAKQFSGVTRDSSYAMTVDSTGNTYISGEFNGTADFDPGAGTVNLTPAGSADGFIVKLNSAGEYIWAKQFGGASYDNGSSIVTDSAGNTYTTGTFVGTADFDPSAGVMNLVSVGAADVYALKLDYAGEFVWVKQFGGTANDSANSIALDTSGNAYVTGNYEGTADFDPGVGIANVTSAGSTAGWGDTFMVKIDTSGQTITTTSTTTTTLAPTTTVASAITPATTIAPLTIATSSTIAATTTLAPVAIVQRSSLPSTGGNSQILLALASFLLTVGAMLIVALRRRFIAIK